MTSFGRKMGMVCLMSVCILLAARDQSMLATYWAETMETSNWYQEISGQPSHRHDPHRFKTNTTLHVRRGLNVINIASRQRISAWIYVGVEQKRLPRHIRMDFTDGTPNPTVKFLRGPDTALRIQANDTVYVNPIYLQEFTRNFLPAITQEFVLLTDNWMVGPLRVNWMHQVSGTIVDSPHVLRWFANDIQLNYTGGMGRHPKVSPFPLGLKQNMPGARMTARKPLATFKRIFNETLHDPSIVNKTTHVFAGHISKTNIKRRAIPNGPLLPYGAYLRAVARSRYVISPDGDHPDCHRHYEALGFGAVPITELDPFFYRHLQEVPVLFNTTNYDMAHLKATLPAEPSEVNRNMVFEESWMEYVERTAGRPLRWWDVVGKRQSFMDDFAIPE